MQPDPFQLSIAGSAPPVRLDMYQDLATEEALGKWTSFQYGRVLRVLSHVMLYCLLFEQMRGNLV